MNYRIILCLLFSTGFLTSVQAGIYDDPQNLKVLPKDISATDLGETMRSFALDVGLRCSSCHMGEEGQDLTEYDFASDDKELKEKARDMLKMVAAINQDYLGAFGENAIKVRCLTCHRGVREPLSIGQVLANVADADGSTAIKTKYAELKEKYYGSGSYNFSEFNLGQVARERAKAGHDDQALAVLDIMLEENPRSFNGHFMYAELMIRAGRHELARQHLQSALEINPQAAPFINPRLEQLDKEEN